MSAGRFVRAKYEMDSPSNTIVPIRVQEETLSLTVGTTDNRSPSGDVSEGWPSAQVSGGRRGLGIFARTCSFVFTGTAPAGYKQDSVITLPVLNKALAAKIAQGVDGTYTLGGSARSIQFVSKVRPEKVR